MIYCENYHKMIFKYKIVLKIMNAKQLLNLVFTLLIKVASDNDHSCYFINLVV